MLWLERALKTIMSEAIVPLSQAEIVAPPPDAPLDSMDAFEWFLQIDVANGDATRDTVNAYRREVGAWVKWCENNGIEVLYATRDHIELFRESLKNRGLTVKTRQFKLSIVRRFYDAAVRHNLIEKNPATGVRAGKDLTAPEDKMKALGLGALGQLVAAIPGDTLSGARDRAIVGLMALHGLRRIEVHRLNHESLQNIEEGEPYLEVEGKGTKNRRVYLRADTLATLEAYAHAKFAAELPLEGAFFVAHGNNGRGGRLSRQALNQIVDKHLGAATLKRAGVSCHALRHTFGTLSVAGGAKIEHLRDAMGHSKIDTTSIYVRAVERAKNNPSNFIDVEI
jgi:site-specific recombinase XerD